MTGWHFSGDPPELMHGYWGLREIARYPIYNKLKGNAFWTELAATEGDDLNSGHRAVERLVEYAVLDWLAQRAPAYGLIDSSEVTLLQGGGSSRIYSEKGTRVPARQPDEGNPLLIARAIEIELPEGSGIVRVDKDLDILIETRHSKVRFLVTSSASGGFVSSYERVGQILRQRLNLPAETPNLTIVGLSVSLQTRQIALRRFSDQAKLEAKWLDRLHASFEKDFSWDRLRQYYAGLS